MPYQRPTYLLHAIWIAALLLCAGVTWLALQQPLVGGSWGLLPSGEVTVILDPEAGFLPTGANVIEVAGGGRALAPRAADFYEDPDFTADYREFNDFMARQAVLSAIAASNEVTLLWRTREESGTLTVKPRERRIQDLPPVFWFQLFVAFSAFTIASWVFLLRPGDFPARMFFATGALLFIAVLPAAVYSTRAFAIPPDQLRLLSALNHVGTWFFACAFLAVFATYPQRLVPLRWLGWMTLFFGLWFSTDLLQWAESDDLTMRLPMLILVLLAFFFAALQWRRSRGLPVERAALRWFVLSMTIGCALVAYNSVVAPLFELAAPVSQGYGIGFFLFMYFGLALGLRRYRLFDMDQWTYRVFLWTAGSAAVILMDAALISLFGLGANLSLGLTLLICGWLYFPLRQWLWMRLVANHSPRIEMLLPELSEIAFIASATEREARWGDLLRRLFDPLELRPCDDIGERPRLAEEGLVLEIPVSGGVSAQRLRYAGRGVRLFSSQDLQVVGSLAHLFNQMVAGREGYERGVAQERRRIGRDLHDNIGARLLKLIHHLRGTPSAEVARDAMKDLRTAISAIDAPPVPLPDALADWRAEAEARCAAAGTRLHWTQETELPERRLHPRAKAMIESVLREAITNALKHALPGHIEVIVEFAPQGLRLGVVNDGLASDPLEWREGFGLRNMRGRLHEFGGTLQVAQVPVGVALTLTVPESVLTRTGWMATEGRNE